MEIIKDSAVLEYLRTTSAERRREITSRVNRDHPEMIPIIVGRSSIKGVPAIKKFKYLVHQEMTFGQFISTLRRHIDKLEDKQAIFLHTINRISPPSNLTMASVYSRYRSSDGFLYLGYNLENTFG